MLRIIFIIVFIPAFTLPSIAQIRATTENGIKVLLFDNGTWQYEEKTDSNSMKSAVTADVVAIDIDTSRSFATEPKDLFYLLSPRFVRFFGESGGNIRCKLSCSNNFGIVKIHFLFEFPVTDGDRYFGLLKEGRKVTFTMEDGQIVALLMGDESYVKRYEKYNYSVISNASQPLDKTEIAALSAQPFRKIEVEWKKSEEYNLGISRFLMETLPMVF